jgi:hypothetical protein
MDMAYSILLGEMVAATEVDYGDPQLFKITCPICMEAVFKAGEYRGKRQYFSHYMRSDATAQCELRVAQMHTEAITAANLKGRGQTLAGFLESHQAQIIHWLWPGREEQMRKRIAWMIARERFKFFADFVHATTSETRKVGVDNQNWQEAESYFRKLRGPFWATQQKRFAIDFCDHLLAPNSKPAFYFLQAVVYLLFTEAQPDHVVWRGMVNARNSTLRNLIEQTYELIPPGQARDRVRQHVPNIERPAYYHGLAWIVTRQLYATLFTLPYFHFLDPNADPVMAENNRELLISFYHKSSATTF